MTSCPRASTELEPVIFFIVNAFDYALAASVQQSQNDSGRRVVVTLRGTNCWRCSLLSCNTQCVHIQQVQRAGKERAFLSEDGKPTLDATGASLQDKDKQAEQIGEDQTTRRLHEAVNARPVSRFPRVRWLVPVSRVCAGRHRPNFVTCPNSSCLITELTVDWQATLNSSLFHSAARNFLRLAYYIPLRADS